MIIDGTKTLAAPRARVWEALDDLDFLRRTIPDCRAISRTDDGGYRATISAGVGPIRANFDVAFARAVQAQQERFTLTGQGSAGVAGAATGSVAVTLEDIAGGTLLGYRAETEVTGKVAQLGARMIDGAARKFSEQFFANVQRELSGAGRSPPRPYPGSRPRARPSARRRQRRPAPRRRAVGKAGGCP